jgi:hypothetical protein
MQIFGYRTTLDLLGMLAREGVIHPRAIRTACDFGAGVGGPSLATQRFFRLPDSQLTLLESDPLQLKILRRLFPKSPVLAGDGLAHLSAGSSTAFSASTDERFDLMTAYMLGPDYHGDGSAMAFLEAALPALSPLGILLVTSDTATMHTLKKACVLFPDIHCRWFLPAPEQCLPVSVVISRESERLNNDRPSITLPTPVLKTIALPNASQETMTEETFPLTNRFERAYLKATIQTFEALTPHHPALPAMRQMSDWGV